MKWDSLSSAATITMGSAPKGESYNFDGEGFPLIAGAGDYGEIYPNPKKWTNAPTKLTSPGDLILCIRATIGDINWADKEYCLGRGVAGIRAKDSSDIIYLSHAITAFKNELMREATGTTFLQIKRSTIENFQIPLPLFAEQRRIAAILDKADAIRKKRQQAINECDEFLKSTFLDMFGDIKAQKTSHPWDTVREYVSAKSGKSSNNIISKSVTKYPIYGGNGVNGWAEKPLYIEPVVIAGRVGQQCGIIHLTKGPCWVTDNAIVIKIMNIEKLNPLYLAYAFTNSPLRDTVKQLDLPFINQRILLDTPIPMPPLSLQEKFAEIVKKTEALKSRMQESQKELDDNFNALSQKAFKGEL
jgi:type I restriction enzyme, S subunit